VGFGGTILRTTTGGVVSVQQDPQADLPLHSSLSQNFPNPFNPSTTIKFQISSSKYVTLKVYAVLGQEVATLVNEELRPGSYKVTWDARAFPSGVYFYRIVVGSFTETRKLVLLR